MRKKSGYFQCVTVRRCSSSLSRGHLEAGNRLIPCALGRNGMTASTLEGDGATPIGDYRFLRAFYRPDREKPRPTGLPLDRITPDFGWCDAPDDGNYNRAVKLPYPASHEKMYREDRLYDWCLLFDQNYSQRMRNRGSAIFFHVAREDFAPTQGCIAIQPKDMRWLIGRIGPATRLVIRA